MPKLRIFLTDDHEVVRAGVRSIIEPQDDMEVVGEAPDGATALLLMPKLKPDIVVLDVSMPNMNGAEASRRIKEVLPATKILALTVHEDSSFIRDLFAAGASGYLLKRAVGPDLVGAIRSICEGGLFLDPRIAGKLVEASSHRGVMAAGTLSKRETEVLQLAARGYSYREIATSLRVGMKTVETYKTRSMEKLGIKTRVELIRYAISAGWLKD